MSDYISSIRLCEFLYNNSLKYTLTERKLSKFIFCIPDIIQPNISKLKMKDLVLAFRTELLVYDLEKQNGILFNLPDTLQCGMLGLSGISNNITGLWKLIQSSIILLKSKIIGDEYKQIFEDSRTDLIKFSIITSQINTLMKNILK
jgi:hypothetical protein